MAATDSYRLAVKETAMGSSGPELRRESCLRARSAS